MKCSKCNGFMFIERYYDHFLRFDAWKCINCGNITDTTIAANKKKAEFKIEQPIFETAEPVLAKVE